MKIKLKAFLSGLRRETDQTGWGSVYLPLRNIATFSVGRSGRVDVDLPEEDARKLWDAIHTGKEEIFDWELSLRSETQGRPIWDDIWTRLAEDLSQRSTCKRSSVGCVVVSEDNSMVLGIGYNGGPKGLNNECLSDEPGKCGHLHAEINALIKTNYRDAAKKKVYVTVEPCYSCAVALVNADVKEVIYGREYRLHDGVELLRRANIAVRRYPRVSQDP